MNVQPLTTGELKGEACIPLVPTPSLSVIVPTLNESGNVEPLVQAIERVLGKSGWEIIFVDDDSSDGTATVAKEMARHDMRMRCIRRIGRQGLASAVIEGVLASSADYVAVIDGDLQHDERLLKDMLDLLKEDQADLVVASRFAPEGDASCLDGVHRHLLSRIGNLLAQKTFKITLSDPMSGYFMVRRQLFDRYASKLSGQGFKVLLDLIASVSEPLRITELPMHFRPRNSGMSKLELSVALAFAAMLFEKTIGRIVPLRFFTFSIVGGTGVLVHLAILKLALIAAWPFAFAQGLAGIVAMTSNFWLNNLTTYRDKRQLSFKYPIGD